MRNFYSISKKNKWKEMILSVWNYYHRECYILRCCKEKKQILVSKDLCLGEKNRWKKVIKNSKTQPRKRNEKTKKGRKARKNQKRKLFVLCKLETFPSRQLFSATDIRRPSILINSGFIVGTSKSLNFIRLPPCLFVLHLSMSLILFIWLL